MKIVIEKIRGSGGVLHDIQLCTGHFERCSFNNPGGYTWVQVDLSTGQVLQAFKEEELLVIDLPNYPASTGPVCKCDIKDLASCGHNIGCPARKNP
jgi:hypothetical protein